MRRRLGVVLIVELVLCGWAVALDCFVSLMAESGHDSNPWAALGGTAMLVSALWTAALALSVSGFPLDVSQGTDRRWTLVISALVLGILPLPACTILIFVVEQTTGEKVLIWGGLIEVMAALITWVALLGEPK